MLVLVLFIVACVIVFCFGFVLLFGAPFLPTLQPQIDTAFELLDLRPGETLLELGCGDGRVLLAAAKRGINTVGYELNPVMATVAWLRTRGYRHYVKIVWGDYWRADWPPAEAVFAFILPRYMRKLHNKVVQYRHKPLKIASFAFPIPNREP